jgi:hypothetical protein
VTANGRTVDEWLPKPGAGHNHHLDTAIGCFVAASMLGCSLPAYCDQRQKVRYVSYRQMWEDANAQQQQWKMG